jgi:sugar lactone lactonase YvrE
MRSRATRLLEFRTVTGAARVLVGSGLLAAAYLAAWPVDIEPSAWDAPEPPEATGVYAPNDALAACQIFVRTPAPGPDTIAFDAIGYLYTGLGDGRVVRISPDGTRTDTLAQIDGRATGVVFDTRGNLLVADEGRGRVHRLESDGKVEPLVRDIDGEPMMLVNDLAVGNDGLVYITESSTRFTLEQLRLEILEHRPNGRIVVYDPAQRAARVLVSDLYFPNGIAVSPDQSHLLFAETTAYRISRYWLRGPKAGTLEVLLDNLPGFPGDVTVSESGRYWLSLLARRSGLVDRLAAWPTVRTVVARLPAAFLPEPEPLPYLLAFDATGRVTTTLQSTSRSDLPSFSSVVENGGFLYMGSPGVGARIDGKAVYRAATPQ